ncbi:APC family permease [Streptomyces sp. A7024]|uniref:APC family permease n=1 Tax=Streptomyces coryli TaxID=1128680 RepID=A0A6G4TYX7_9ACTN|nr:APC family permease [Streptomyces coryli]NGN64328.1 APC family permease [Streptomyces coryli]
MASPGAGSATSHGPRERLRAWLLEGQADRVQRHQGPHARPPKEEKRHAWWKVMCLSGLDYFSTLGYQPGIAAVAAGLLSPLATLVLVAVTLAGALPVYRRVAEESPNGQGSIAMLERLLPFWRGKLFVLFLLGFAATDFIITITLSAADGAAHLVENPHLASTFRGHNLGITLLMIALLGAVFLKGFNEAIGFAVPLVGVFLLLNAIVIAVGLWHVITTPHVIPDWSDALTTEHGSGLAMVGIALLVFPKLALGLSGFETGVAVMPHIKGREGEPERRPLGRIVGAKKLLTTAAVTMSVFLICSSVVTTLLIPEKEFDPGGPANGRALAYLAHEHLGNTFGSIYDAATIAILWFAGASAMAGLLNLMPRYLPRYGMAPSWARAVRPAVLTLVAAAFLITWIFDASVDKQGGAYATGVLVLITSAAIAVTIAARRAGQRRLTVFFTIVSAIFVYTTAANVIERPDGMKIGACFIAAIVGSSLLSRLRRAFELRITGVIFDPLAEQFVRDQAATGTIRLVANEPGERDEAEYRDKLRQIHADNDLREGDDVVFIEVAIGDPSEFEADLYVRGEVLHGRHKVLTLKSPAIPNALAAVLLHVRDLTGQQPHIYFEWTEGNPIGQFARFFFFGHGEVAPVTREVLREAEPDRAKRPHVHVG